MNCVETVLFSPWMVLFLTAWLFLSVYVILKKDFLNFSEIPPSFPFSLKQLFFLGFFLCIAVCVYLFSFVVVHSIVGALQCSFIQTGTTRLVIEQIVGLLLAFVVFLCGASHLPSDVATIVMGSSGGWKKLLVGVFYGIVFYPIIFAVAWLVGVCVSLSSSGPREPQVVISFLTQLNHSTWLFWILLASIVTIVPYIEEIVFRGFLQGFLGGILHPMLSTLIIAFAFSFFHYSSLQKSGNFEIMSGLFVFSLLASRLRMKENSVMSSVGMHAVFNMISLMLFLVQKM